MYPNTHERGARILRMHSSILCASLFIVTGVASFGMVSRGGPNHLALSQAVRSAGIDPRKLRTVVFKTNAEPNMSRHFLRGQDFSQYLDEEFSTTRAVMADLGLAK